ncbi:hypothetical protein L0888_004750, partial [Escherichia coli]|nr:hypothetical protein [Escherichia coli]
SDLSVNINTVLASRLPENKGLHLRYQANSIKTRRVISYLTLAENVLRHSPLILGRTVLSTVLNHLAKTYQNMVLVY